MIGKTFSLMCAGLLGLSLCNAQVTYSEQLNKKLTKLFVTDRSVFHNYNQVELQTSIFRKIIKHLEQECGVKNRTVLVSVVLDENLFEGEELIEVKKQWDNNISSLFYLARKEDDAVDKSLCYLGVKCADIDSPVKIIVKTINANSDTFFSTYDGMIGGNYDYDKNLYFLGAKEMEFEPWKPMEIIIERKEKGICSH